MSSSH